MVAPTLIRKISVRPLNIPLRSPFGISGGSQDAVENVLVEVELADGTLGLGEGAPFPAYNGETQAQALSGLQAFLPRVPGRNVSEWAILGEEFAGSAKQASGSATAALEMALLDAFCRTRGEPLWKFFGGAGYAIETDMTVTTGSVEEARADAHAILRRGIHTIKVKVGAGSVGFDLDRLAAIRDAAPEAPLILDGNAGLTRRAARHLAKGIKALGVEPLLLEQWLPKDDFEGMRMLGNETGWLIAADESAATVGDVERLAAARAVQVVNIKLMKRGIAEAMAVAEAAKRCGLKLMVGGNVESILAMTVSACFGAGTGGFSYADLDTPFFLADNPFEGGFVSLGATLTVSHISAGHGVRLREAGPKA
jgi:L-alanine-DL-glutamate epimerase-like enolase superfamily enzyme